MNDTTESSRPEDTLERACHRIATGLVVRYGTTLFSRTHGDMHEFVRQLVLVMKAAGLTKEDAFALQNWLKQGLRPFSDYPPQIEILLHLAYLVRSYPITEYQQAIKPAWYALDTTYGQTYFKSWRSDKPIDEMARERVWLTSFEKMSLTEKDINRAMECLQESALFRQFPPTLEQFMDAVLAVRQNAPLVEVAWLESANKVTASTHPLVVQARSLVGSHDLNMAKRDKEMETRFKAVYRKLLCGEAAVPAPIILEDEAQTEREYESPDILAERIKRW